MVELQPNTCTVNTARPKSKVRVFEKVASKRPPAVPIIKVSFGFGFPLILLHLQLEILHLPITSNFRHAPVETFSTESWKLTQYTTHTELRDGSGVEATIFLEDRGPRFITIPANGVFKSTTL